MAFGLPTAVSVKIGAILLPTVFVPETLEKLNETNHCCHQALQTRRGSGGACAMRCHRLDGDRGEGVWSAKRAHGALPWRGVCGGLFAQGQSGSGGKDRRSGPLCGCHHQSRPHRENRGWENLRNQRGASCSHPHR